MTPQCLICIVISHLIHVANSQTGTYLAVTSITSFIVGVFFATIIIFSCYLPLKSSQLCRLSPPFRQTVSVPSDYYMDMSTEDQKLENHKNAAIEQLRVDNSNTYETVM